MMEVERSARRRTRSTAAQLPSVDKRAGRGYLAPNAAWRPGLRAPNEPLNKTCVVVHSPGDGRSSRVGLSTRRQCTASGYPQPGAPSRQPGGPGPLDREKVAGRSGTAGVPRRAHISVDPGRMDMDMDMEAARDEKRWWCWWGREMGPAASSRARGAGAFYAVQVRRVGRRQEHNTSAASSLSARHSEPFLSRSPCPPWLTRPWM